MAPSDRSACRPLASFCLFRHSSKNVATMAALCSRNLFCKRLRKGICIIDKLHVRTLQKYFTMIDIKGELFQFISNGVIFFALTRELVHKYCNIKLLTRHRLPEFQWVPHYVLRLPAGRSSFCWYSQSMGIPTVELRWKYAMMALLCLVTGRIISLALPAARSSAWAEQPSCNATSFDTVYAFSMFAAISVIAPNTLLWNPHVMMVTSRWWASTSTVWLSWTCFVSRNYKLKRHYLALIANVPVYIWPLNEKDIHAHLKSKLNTCLMKTNI